MTVMLVAFAACESEETIETSSDDTPFRVIAEVAQQVHSRAYDEYRYIRGGIYRLTYINTDNKSYYVADVDFHKENSEPGIGFVTVPSTDPVDRDLTWKKVGGGNTPEFYLDNVGDDDDTPKESKLVQNYNPATGIVSFTEKGKERYKAGLYLGDQEKDNDGYFHGDEGSNDLLWGSTTANRNASPLNFNLHHCMARVKVQVTVDHTNDSDGELSLEGATVSISNLVHTPDSYNRLNGSLSLGENPTYKDLVLVGKNDGTETDDEYNWATSVRLDPKGKESESGTTEVYTSCDFVLPPQDLLTDDRRPKLIIRLANGTVYSGILPHAMVIDDGGENKDDKAYPVALSFLREHILTIRTLITEDPPELAFMPVWVVQWVEKDEFTIEAHQSGIYKADEFYKLIEYYNASNEYQLVRYGKLSGDGNSSGEDKWVFDFWHSVVLEQSQIAGCMVPGNGKKDFSFNFNNYTIFLKNGQDSTPEELTATALYNLVTGKTSATTP